MIHLIVACHGRFAEELVNSAAMVFGEAEDVHAVTFMPGEGPEDLIRKYEAIMAEAGISDDVLFLVDLFGGSPYNAAIRVADAYAAEHLEIHTENAREGAERITNAGAIFVGEHSPVPLGDYSAGSNHVLPTSGTARHSSGLSTHTFLKSVHLIDYDEAALKDIADTVVTLADAEQLPAHGEAIRARFENL